MKTIMDAVNEYEGEWPYNNNPTMCTTSESNNNFDYPTFKASSGISVNEYHIHVCTKEEFNTLVQECSHHAGIELFNEYVKADKKLLEKESKVIDWSKAPDGADIYIEDGDDYTESFIKRVSVSGYYVMDMEDTCKKWVYQEAPQSLIDELISVGIHRPKPQPKESNMKPVYTNQMRDDDVLPEIGLNCLLSESRNSHDGYSAFVAGNNAGEQVYITAHLETRTGLKMAAYFSNNENKRFGGVACARAFAPIDQRTDKEKTIDELHSKFPYKTGGQLLSLAYDKWVGK